MSVKFSSVSSFMSTENFVLLGVRMGGGGTLQWLRYFVKSGGHKAIVKERGRINSIFYNSMFEKCMNV